MIQGRGLINSASPAIFQLDQPVSVQCEIDTGVDVAGQYFNSLSVLPPQRAIEQDLVFLGGGHAPKHNGHHLITQILVIDRSLRVDQDLRSAS